MYLDFEVIIPEVPGKIGRFKKGGTMYVCIKDSGLFLDLAVYSIIAENNAAQYYPNYVYNYLLFTAGMQTGTIGKRFIFLMIPQTRTVGRAA